MQWFSNNQIPDRADMINGRGYVKPPLLAIACTTQLLPEEVHQYTEVTIEGTNIVAKGIPAFVIPVAARVTWLDACYDQVNRLNAAWIEGGILQHYWYDPTIAEFTITSIGPAERCFLFMDDVRFEASSSALGSSIFLLYETSGELRQREQADRYTAETVIATLLPNEHLVGVGMNSKYRIQAVLQRETREDSGMLDATSPTYIFKIDDTAIEIDGSIVVYEA